MFNSNLVEDSMPTARRRLLAVIGSSVLVLASGLAVLVWQASRHTTAVVEVPPGTGALETVTLTIDGMT